MRTFPTRANGNLPLPDRIEHRQLEIAPADDYLTVIQSPNGTRPINKEIGYTDGAFTKTPLGRQNQYFAKTVKVSVPEKTKSLIAGLPPHQAILAGWLPGFDEYRIVSSKRLARELGLRGKKAKEVRPLGCYIINGVPFVARLKENFSPSTWRLFDYDPNKDMPDSLRVSSFHDWLELILRIEPSLKGVAAVYSPSTSNRIVQAGKLVFGASANLHAWVQAEVGAEDLDRRADYILSKSITSDLDYAKSARSRETGKIVSYTTSTIVDTGAMVGTNGLVFDGEPVLTEDAKGAGAVVIPSDVRIHPGGRSRNG